MRKRWSCQGKQDVEDEEKEEEEGEKKNNPRADFSDGEKGQVMRGQSERQGGEGRERGRQGGMRGEEGAADSFGRGVRG